MRRGSALLIACALVLVLALALAGCGSSSSSSSAASAGSSTSQATTSSTAPAAPSTSSTAATSAPAHSGGTASVTTGPVRGMLHAPDHTPVVNKNWHYSVVVTDAAGHPLAGTVDIEFTFGGQVVGHDTPPTHPLKNGRWSDNLKFPVASVGEPLTFQVVAHTHQGSITLDWPVTVKQ
jgi:hypothetical protein